MDLTFDDDQDWNYGLDSPTEGEIDFESVALHEFGHATLLGHVNNLADPMYYAYFAGPESEKRTLNSTNISSARTVHLRSTVESGDDECHGPMANYCCPANNIDDDGICDLYEVEGCTDSSACNYNDDSFCTYAMDGFDCNGNCFEGSIVTLTLYDSYGDSWNGNSLTINGVDYEQPNTSPTPGEFASDSYTLCLDLSTCITVTYNLGDLGEGDTFPEENSWELTDSYGEPLASGGDASGTVGTCADCAGVINGTSVVDECGVCGGDNLTCADCAGVINGTSLVDECGVCGGDNSSCAGCDGVPNSGLVNDECGVCGGDNSSCAGCDGVANSGLVNDECGVCGGSGIPEGDCDCAGNQLDECGVCGGVGIAEGDCDCEGTQPEEGYDCLGNCITDIDGNGTCDEFEVYGCQDSNACNYNELATVDGDNCITMSTCPCELEGQLSATLESMEISAPLVQIADMTDLHSIEITLEFFTENLGLLDGFFPSDLAMSITSPSGGCGFFGGEDEDLPLYCPDGSPAQEIGAEENDEGGVWPLSWSNVDASGSFNGTYFASVDLSAIDLSGSGEWYFQIANWYELDNGLAESTASFDVSWVIYHNCSGCNDVSACNYDESATNDETCIFALGGYDCDNVCLDTDTDGICDIFEIVGCQQEAACNFDQDATNAGYCDYAETGYDCDGLCVNDADGDGICDEFEADGCTDCSACNFNSDATDEDGSCSYAQVGYDCDGACLVDIDEDGVCDHLQLQTLINNIELGFYCGAGTIWNPELQQCLTVDNCPGDLNGDQDIGASDLLLFLAVYSSTCPE